MAVGDVFVGGRDEIVVSGWNYDADTGKNGIIVVLKWTPLFGWTGSEIEADTGGYQRIHDYLTVPVHLNADNSGNLEIALRTFNATYTGSADSWLYVWEYTGTQWSCMNGFPKTFPGTECDYSPPVYIGDTDSDNYPELVVSKGTETLYWIEPETGQNSTWDVSSELPLTYNSTTLNWNLGQSYITAVSDGGTCKLIVVGRHGLTHTSAYYVTACLDAENSGNGLWNTAVRQTNDHYGNFGGPAIADIDGDNGLEVVNQWNESSTRLVEYLNLSNGSRTSMTGIPYNDQQEDNAMSPVVISGDEGDGFAAFYGLSTVQQGSAFYNGYPDILPGSALWSGDLARSTPVVGNLDSDSYFEVLFGDDSGVLYALDMDLDSSSGDWPSLQHDLHRTGYYNFSGRGTIDTGLDLRIVGVERDIDSSRDLGTSQIYVNVMIEGANVSSHNVTEVPVPHISSTQILERLRNDSRVIPEANVPIASASPAEMVQVVLFSGTTMLETRNIPVTNGTHAVAFNYTDNLESGDLIVMVDPFMKFDEIDEENNTLDIAGELIESTLVNKIVLSSSKEGVSITIPTEILSGNLVTAMLYSVDGRIVAQESAEVDTGGSFSIGLQGGNGYFPSGCYVLLLRDGDNLIIRRKLLVIEQ